MRITWNEIRACDPDYFGNLDDEYEQAHLFLFPAALKLLLAWFKSQPGDYATNRRIMKGRLPAKLYLMVLEGFVDENYTPVRKAETRRLLPV